MAKGTGIQYVDETTNPVMGCVGCELWKPNRGVKICYAGILHDDRLAGKSSGYAPQFDMPTLYPGRMAGAAASSDLVGTARKTKPWLNGYPRLIFISDMGDALSEGQYMHKSDLEGYKIGVGISFPGPLRTEQQLTARGSQARGGEPSRCHEWRLGATGRCRSIAIKGLG